MAVYKEKPVLLLYLNDVLCETIIAGSIDLDIQISEQYYEYLNTIGSKLEFSLYSIENYTIDKNTKVTLYKNHKTDTNMLFYGVATNIEWDSYEYRVTCYDKFSSIRDKDILSKLSEFINDSANRKYLRRANGNGYDYYVDPSMFLSNILRNEGYNFYECTDYNSSPPVFRKFSGYMFGDFRQYSELIQIADNSTNYGSPLMFPVYRLNTFLSEFSEFTINDLINFVCKNTRVPLSIIADRIYFTYSTSTVRYTPSGGSQRTYYGVFVGDQYNRVVRRKAYKYNIENNVLKYSLNLLQNVEDEVKCVLFTSEDRKYLDVWVKSQVTADNIDTFKGTTVIIPRILLFSRAYYFAYDGMYVELLEFYSGNIELIDADMDIIDFLMLQLYVEIDGRRLYISGVRFSNSFVSMNLLCNVVGANKAKSSLYSLYKNTWDVVDISELIQSPDFLKNSWGNSYKKYLIDRIFLPNGVRIARSVNFELPEYTYGSAKFEGVNITNLSLYAKMSRMNGQTLLLIYSDVYIQVTANNIAAGTLRSAHDYWYTTIFAPKINEALDNIFKLCVNPESWADKRPYQAYRYIPYDAAQDMENVNYDDFYFDNEFFGYTSTLRIRLANSRNTNTVTYITNPKFRIKITVRM